MAYLSVCQGCHNKLLQAKWLIFLFCFVFLFLFSVLTATRGMWDLSFSRGDQTRAPLQWKLGVLTTGLPGNSQKTKWLKQHKFIVLVLKGINSRSRCQKGWFLLKSVRKNLLHASPLPSAGGFLAIFDIPWLVETSSQCLPSSHMVLSLCVCILQISLFCKDTSLIGLEAHPTPG